jgi:regulatory protein YycH of two-component signal transduction system YycFG
VSAAAIINYVNSIPNYTITSGNTIYSTSGFTNQVGSWNDSANYFDVFPPAGKSMANLVAFMPSIAVIHYAGGVNSDDSMRCTWSNLGNRIRVYVQNTEQRSTPAANYLAIWR